MTNPRAQGLPPRERPASGRSEEIQATALVGLGLKEVEKISPDGSVFLQFLARFGGDPFRGGQYQRGSIKLGGGGGMEALDSLKRKTPSGQGRALLSAWKPHKREG